MKAKNFSFGDHAPRFDEHIGASIPGLHLLRDQCVANSRRFIQGGTNVIDVGCSTGTLLAAVEENNRFARSNVSYIGLDIESKFSESWLKLQRPNLGFEVVDARDFETYDNTSLALSIFTVQFMPEQDKQNILQRLFDGLVEGGALIIAEKVLASSARMQDALTGPYYDWKRQRFTSQQILDKEQTLRGHLTPWDEEELKRKLKQTGFREIDMFWKNFPFVALIAVK